MSAGTIIALAYPIAMLAAVGFVCALCHVGDPAGDRQRTRNDAGHKPTPGNRP